MPLTSGTLVGTYHLLDLVGSGGMGEVYRATDTKLHRSVAIKFLSDDLADAAARRRFQREAQMASSLNHLHIVTVHDIGEFQDRQYLVIAMPLTDAGTSNIWAIPTDGRPARPLTDFGERPILIARQVSWSPDGRFIYAAVVENDADIVLLDGMLP